MTLFMHKRYLLLGFLIRQRLEPCSTPFIVFGDNLSTTYCLTGRQHTSQQPLVSNVTPASRNYLARNAPRSKLEERTIDRN